MKAMATVVMIICLLAVLNALRGGAEFPVSHLVPFLGGHPPGMYDWAALAVVAITANGVRRLLSPATDDDEDEAEEYEEVKDASSDIDDSDDDQEEEEDEP